MRIVTIVFAVLSTVFVSAGIAHHPRPVVFGPNIGPTPTCPARKCGSFKK